MDNIYEEMKTKNPALVNSLRTEIDEMRSSYEDRLRKKDLAIQEQTEHLIQRLNNEVNRTRKEMTDKMRAELNQTTKDTMERNQQLTTELKVLVDAQRAKNHALASALAGRTNAAVYDAV